MQINKIFQTILKNQKLETIIVALALGGYLFREQHIALYNMIENTLVAAYSEHRLSLIISATAIILGIYIAVISVIATSILGITKDMIQKGKHEQLLQIVFTGMIVNSVLVFVCVLFTVDVGWKALIISTLLAVSIVAFAKFMWLLFLIFQANLIAMNTIINTEQQKEEELLTILKKIEQSLIKDNQKGTTRR